MFLLYILLRKSCAFKETAFSKDIPLDLYFTFLIFFLVVFISFPFYFFFSPQTFSLFSIFCLFEKFFHSFLSFIKISQPYLFTSDSMRQLSKRGKNSFDVGVSFIKKVLKNIFSIVRSVLRSKISCKEKNT